MVRPVCDGSHRFNFVTSSPPLLPPELPGSQSVAESSRLELPPPALHWGFGAARRWCSHGHTERVRSQQNGHLLLDPSESPLRIVFFRAWCGSIDGTQASSPALLARHAIPQGVVGSEPSRERKSRAPKDQRGALSYEHPFATTPEKTRSELVQARTDQGDLGDGVGEHSIPQQALSRARLYASERRAESSSYPASSDERLVGWLAAAAAAHTDLAAAAVPRPNPRARSDGEDLSFAGSLPAWRTVLAHNVLRQRPEFNCKREKPRLRGICRSGRWGSNPRPSAWETRPDPHG